MSNPGYKSMKISFQTLFERLINGGTAASSQTGGTNPMQLGTAMGVGNVYLDFSQGSPSEGGQYDLFIQGSGLFVVSPDGGLTTRYTRTGQFLIDAQGNLVTTTGMQVYGMNGGALVQITGLQNFNLAGLSWSSDGRLVQYAVKADGTLDTSTELADTGYRIALTSFANLSGLAQAEGNTFAETAASGTPQDYQAPGGTFGTVTPRTIEQSNVFYTGEIIDAQEAERAMSGNLTIVRMINDDITNFINKLS
jgi:flagellar hook protein FlgE